MKKLSPVLALLLALMLCLPAQAQSVYALGDTIDDFSITTPAGDTVTLSGLLETHKAVLINFWFDGCGWCDYEFPYLQQAYEEMGQEVAVLALSPFDKDEAVSAYQQKGGYTFTMAHDSAGLSQRFGISSYPVTLMIDRFGVYCFSKSGAIDSQKPFLRLMEFYAADDYAQPQISYDIPPARPTQSMPAPEEMAAALSAGASVTYSAQADAWPWLLHADGYAYASNSGEANTAAVLNAALQAPAGDALAFDYKVSSQKNDDYLVLYLNGVSVKTFTGEEDWQSFALPLEEGGNYDIQFVYWKNGARSGGDDIACIDNVRVLSGEEAQAALALNAPWPQVLSGTDIIIDILNEEVKEVLVDDPSGTMDSLYPGARYCIVPGETLQARVRIGKLIDPEYAAAISFSDSAFVSLSTLETDEEGYLVSLPIESLDTTGAAWTALVIFPYFEDYDHSTSLFYFASEEDLTYFCQNNISADLDATWRYADAQE